MRGGSVFGRCVVVGGAGAVGRMFSHWLVRSGVAVTWLDVAGAGAADGVRVVAGDVRRPGPEAVAALAAADVVVLAVPEPVAWEAVEVLAGVMRPGAVLADTLSVKSRIAGRLREAAPGLQAVGLNPMFAPSLGLQGRPVAAVVVTDGPGVRALVELVAGWGARVVEMPARRHDELTAAQQAATHAAVLAFGLGLGELSVDVGALRDSAPPPHLAMLALLARIAGGTPEVYFDIQAANPGAPAARQALGRGLVRLGQAVERGDEETFAALFAELRGVLGEHGAELERLCARMFTALH
ncbi:prephenate dehydrogenase/arogenate dehydrogenase family protein [Streptomyces pristinaespiralis]|uniref:4-amino-4-deoxyprephenate dehydrogenase n=2 Tax=Streptomyces pristinaespiralis TaxID=38300 RepID=PAPC_STRPR|nr:RecName: Full=4-amino-4-deoxyprephenate dehydrogenase [Streptomyces pristinaespiralis]AAC44867.1 PapC [Streptomyces pristinaespiralis]ALC18611.1 4-amino-4-deoxyprephenate dehydrogenase [Streptomyces pristinaespiralis]ALC25354.1 4-amino-4-deoxyprephenate dehydrogenase [Streptomyces pristinaespiralis]QMU12426.1 prephenate dehydrogenase/arogenate dehydrogenase family protein [Streptomyces pristinaespiralis]CBW45754.1 dehydrogenase [Streptomyces pristinaespiralis]